MKTKKNKSNEHINELKNILDYENSKQRLFDANELKDLANKLFNEEKYDEAYVICS